MLKKVEIWILNVVVFVGILAFTGFGALIRHEVKNLYHHFGQDPKLPAFSRAAPVLSEMPSALVSVRKNSSTQPNRIPEHSGFEGKPLQHDADLLLARYDSNPSESGVELVELRFFAISHTWNPDIKGAGPSFQQHDVNI